MFQDERLLRHRELRCIDAITLPARPRKSSENSSFKRASLQGAEQNLGTITGRVAKTRFRFGLLVPPNGDVDPADRGLPPASGTGSIRARGGLRGCRMIWLWSKFGLRLA